MIRQVVDRRELDRYVEAVRARLDAPELQDAAARAADAFAGTGDPVAKLRAALPPVSSEFASSGGSAGKAVPFISRDPIQSLLQSTLEEKLRERGVPEDDARHRSLLGCLIHLLRSVLHPVRYGPEDPDWVIDVVAAMLDRLARGNHRFNPLPAEHRISDDARVVIVGDWGTGLPRAQAVARLMAEEVAGALGEGREAHVVHLGDIYYSGLEQEVRRHVLAPGMWPVTLEQARAGVTSWSLNGNHDMYGGGYGYYETLLEDERFSSQRSSDGEGTSFFRLRSPSWDLVALDTSWDSDVLSTGFVGVLEDPQAEFVSRVAEESERKLMLLSHHQLVSVYDPSDIGSTLPKKLAPVLESRRVTAWLWGHEHRCMGFEEVHKVKFPRCIGHGGVPTLMEHAQNELIPAPGAWEERGFEEYRGDRWQRFGFAVLDLEGEQIDVRYREDQGSRTRSETIA
ncbi:MAG TPA: metallophosphoesterase [Solirubrobacteraceae bacterium]|jgi:hypothetical protein|nr:metallophosphoesterase [Solirubrobacteraceae bacterium]